MFHPWRCVSGRRPRAFDGQFHCRPGKSRRLCAVGWNLAEAFAVSGSKGRDPDKRYQPNVSKIMTDQLFYWTGEGMRGPLAGRYSGQLACQATPDQMTRFQSSTASSVLRSPAPRVAKGPRQSGRPKLLLFNKTVRHADQFKRRSKGVQSLGTSIRCWACIGRAWIHDSGTCVLTRSPAGSAASSRPRLQAARPPVQVVTLEWREPLQTTRGGDARDGYDAFTHRGRASLLGDRGL